MPPNALVLAVCAAVAYAAYILCTRGATQAIGTNTRAFPPTTLLLLYGIGIVVTYTCVVMWFMSSGRPLPWSHPKWPTVSAWMVGSGIVGSVGAFLVVTCVYVSGCATWTSLITQCLPVLLVAVVSVCCFGERLTPVGWLALVVALVAIAVLTVWGVSAKSST